MAARRRLAGMVALLIGGWLIAVGGQASAAPATSIDDRGWWTRTNQEPTIGGALAPPDVSEGQLVVEGTPEGATAIAALRASLPVGTGAPVLTLRVASEAGGSSADLLACQTGSAWTGADGGAWDAKPSPDCSQSVQGIRAEDGSSWTFALAPLQFDQRLDVVFAPGVDPALPDGLNGSAFRLVFEPVEPTDIEVSEQASADGGIAVPEVTFAEPDAPSSPPGDGSGAAPSFDGGTSGSSSFSVPTPPSAQDLSSQPAQAALPAGEQGLTATAPVLGAENPLETASPIVEPGDGGRVLGAFVVLIGLALLAWSSTQPVPDHQLLSRFAGTSASVAAVPPATTTEARLGGLGRFERARSAPARRLGG